MGTRARGLERRAPPRAPGVYADLDFEALQNPQPLLDGRHVVLAAMEDESATDQQAVPNAWMASTRHHPFWLFAVAQVIKAASAPEERRARRPAAAALPDARPAPGRRPRRGGAGARWDVIEATTGPISLYKAVAAYRAAGGLEVSILSPSLIYPVNWRATVTGPQGAESDALSVCNPAHASFDEAACKAQFPNAYALTYWTGSWKPPNYGR